MMRRRRLVLLALLLATLGGALAGPPAARAVGVWTPTAAPDVDRGTYVTSATPLRDGQILVASSGLPGGVEPPPGAVTTYDPATDRWAGRGPFPTFQGREAPAPLPDGRVLFTGGAATWDAAGRTATGAAQLYDAAAGVWSPVAPLASPRLGHRAAVLQDGTVLVAGGLASDRPSQGSDPGERIAVPGAERYDPQTDRWLPAGRLATPRTGHTMTLLRDGRVLVVGGSEPGKSAARPELYDPATNAWTDAGSDDRRRTSGHTATLLPDGRVLVVGGSFYSVVPILADTQLYDPATNTWTGAAPMATGRTGHTATLLPNGQVLVAGGACCGFYTPTPLASTELYDPARDAWAGAAPMSVRRILHTATPLPGGGVFAVGGASREGADPPLSPYSPEVYTPSPEPSACFPETGQCVAGRFLAYWRENGGLARHGYPLTAVRGELLEDGRAYQVQYFERSRLEYHPENAAPYDVLLGQFGRRIGEAQPRAEPLPGREFFFETGHNVGGRFLDYWRANGGLAQFGLPITEEIPGEVVAGERAYAQYFERARFEYHPENRGTPHDVLLGQFGRAVLEQNALLAGNQAFATVYLTNPWAREHLGLARGPATVVPGAAQRFERGLMIWRGDRREIYALGFDRREVATNNPHGIAFPDTWAEGDDPGGGPAPTPGLYLPQRGFGKLWRESEWMRRTLGYATTAREAGFPMAIQEFDRGYLLHVTASDGRYIYGLYLRREPDGFVAGAGFERFNDPPR